MTRPARLGRFVASHAPRSFMRGVARCAVGLALAAIGGCVTHVQPAPKVEPRYVAVAHDPTLPPFLHNTILDRTLLDNHTPYPVSAYGLVGQLRGTGDGNAPGPVRQFMIKELSRRGFGDPLVPGFGHIQPAEVLKDKNYAIVVVEAEIPPGARKGDFIDVRVSCLQGNSTRSLAHGRLFETDLKKYGADKDAPGVGIDTLVRVKGPILVNPAYALQDGLPTGAARSSLRNGVVMGNARVMQDRPIFLRLRDPSLRTARAIERCIRDRFQDESVAVAEDEGVVQLFVPRAYRGDWEHFVGVCQHLWLDAASEPSVAVAKARMLAGEAQKPDAPLEDISYGWEALDREASMPFLQPLLTNPKPDVAFAAARAAAFLGDAAGAAEASLVQMARTPAHPFRISAVQTLGALPSSSAVNHMLRGLLDSEQATVRVEAYKVLARNRDSSIYTTVIGPAVNPTDERFALDIVPSDGPPLIYASRQGNPRIAVIGKTPDLRLPVTFTALDNRLTISSAANNRLVTLFYRDATTKDDRDDRTITEPVKVMSQPDVPELIARLGGAGPREDARLNLTYGEVLAIVQRLADNNQLGADDTGRPLNAVFVLQEPPQVQNAIKSAAVIGEASITAPRSGEGPGPRLGDPGLGDPSSRPTPRLGAGNVPPVSGN